MVTFAVGFIDVPGWFRFVFTAACLVMLPFSWLGCRNLWRDRTRVFDEPFGFWPYSDALWRGYVRGMPAGVTAFTSGIVLVLYAIWGSANRYAALVVTVLCLGLAALGLLLAATAAFASRPRRVVPPHLREQPGVVSEWRENWRRRRTRASA